MNIFDIGVNHLPQTITAPNQKVLWKIVARNNGNINLTTGITLQLTWSTPVIYHRTSDVTDTAGQTFGNGTAAGTFLNRATDLWAVGGLAVGQEKTLIVETSLPSGTNLATALPLSLTKVISVTGITDIESDNNTSIDVLLGPSLDIDCAPAAAAVDGQGCKCSVAENDTPCNYGITEWRLVPGSFVNTIEANLNFNSSTGEYTSYQIDPTKVATFQYGIYCLKDGIEVSGPFIATETILPKFNKKSLNHTPYFVEGTSLTPAEVAILQTQYPALSNITDLCWTIIRNGDGELTGGIANDCNQEQDTRTFYECTSDPCTTTSSCVSYPQSYLPNDVYTSVMASINHEPQIGDIIFLQHPTGHSVHKWNGYMWERSSCGCVSYLDGVPYPTALSVTGTTTKTVTITMSSGPALTATFTDIDTDTDTDTNTTYTLRLNGAGTAFELVDNNNTVVSTINFPTTTSSCPNIELDVLPQISDVGSIYNLRVNGITNADPAWNTWIWQSSDKYGSGNFYNPNPVWINTQIGGMTITQGGDDLIFRVVLTIGSCTYYSNESGYEPAIIGKLGSGITVTQIVEDLWEVDYIPTVVCPIRLEAFNYMGLIFPIITGAGNVTVFGDPAYNPNAFTFQLLGGTAPAFTWTDVQTGVDIPSNKLLYSSTTEDFYRIKYTDPNGCEHYSNIVQVVP